MLRATALASCLILAACSGSPEPLGQAAVMDTAASSSSAVTPSTSVVATSPPSSTPTEGASSSSNAPGGPLSAQVIGIEPSKESEPYVHASITFDNPGAGDCKVTAYTLTWPGGTKTVKVDDFTVSGRSTAKRSMKVHPNDGKLESLDTHATVTLKSSCP